MKFYKLALASVAAFGLAGAAMADDDPIFADGLESWLDQNLAVSPDTGINVEGNSTPTAGAVWFTTTKSEDTLVTKYGEGGEPTKERPTEMVGTTNTKYLKVSNSSPLWRVLLPYTYNTKPEAFGDLTPAPSTGAESMDVAVGDGLYIDTLVQFTPSEDAPTPESGSKLIVWMNAESNLCVTAGLLSWDGNGEPTAEPTNFVTSTQLETNTWYRLTVYAFGNVFSSDASAEMNDVIINGFAVKIDGTLVTSTTAVVDDTFMDLDGEDMFNGNAFSGSAKSLITARQYFASLDDSGEAATLAAVGFKGEGLVDDIVVTTEEPTFTPSGSGIDFTLTWDEGVSAVWYAIGGTTNNVASASPATITVDNAEAGVTQVTFGGIATDVWKTVATATETLAASDNSYTLTATDAATAGAAGVEGDLAGFTPAQLKAAFPDKTPAQINDAANAYLDYQFGQALDTLSAAPTLKIVDIAESETAGYWDVKVQVLNGETPLAVDNGSASPMRATLTAIASATLEGFPTAPSKDYDLIYDSTTTDLTVKVLAEDGKFFKAYIKYAVPENN